MDNRKIAGIVEGDSCCIKSEKTEREVIDAKGNYLAPGFIDIHTHGGGGSDFMDNEHSSYENILKLHMSHVTTALTPTTLASSHEDLLESVRNYEKFNQVPKTLGIHLEDPYCSSEQRGAQEARFLKNPDPKEYLKILESTSCIKRWSVAPELNGA